MHFKLLYPSEYLAACDLGGKDATVTIDKIAVEKIPGAEGQKEEKPVVWFRGKKKRMVLNKTNAKAIAHKHGNDTDQWIGKQITLYPTTCQAFGAVHECLRVR